MRLILIAAAAASLATFAQAQPVAGGTCAEAARVIDGGLKDLSAIEARGIGDDSAPRATMRAAEQGAQYAMIQSNLAIMISAHCPLPRLPITASVYLEAASGCILARGDEIKAKCDRGAWQPGPRWRASPAG